MAEEVGLGRLRTDHNERLLYMHVQYPVLTLFPVYPFRVDTKESVKLAQIRVENERKDEAARKRAAVSEAGALSRE